MFKSPQHIAGAKTAQIRHWGEIMEVVSTMLMRLRASYR